MRRAIGLGIALTLWAPAASGQTEEATSALYSGRYDVAIATWEGMLRRGDVSPADVRGLLIAYMRGGDYGRAIEVGTTHADSGEPTAAAALNTLGEALYATGREREARTRFEAAIAAAAPDSLTARLNVAIADFERGDRGAAMRGFDTFIDVYNRGEARTAADLIAVARACTYLGIEDPQLFHDAVRAFDAAIARDPSNPEPRLLLGELFLTKYDGTEAGVLIGEALRLDGQWARAHLAEAQRLQFEGSPDARARVERALELNPNLVAAHVLRGSMQLATGARAEAAADADRALAINPDEPAALALIAAVRYLDGDTVAYELLQRRARELNPRSAMLLETVAEQAAQNRLYARAVELATAAVEVDPDSWESWGTLGLNQLRIGQIDEGRTSLENAFAGDPFNVWYKNTLDLLDTFDRYQTISTPHFELFVREDRAELVAPYLAAIAEESWERLTAKYGYAPTAPIRIEVFERHADFSVRTVGLAGLGALGVAFGPVIAVDAPGVTGVGEFNWASTLWHEIAHVVAMGLSEGRVPRWFTEGLSVYEEHHARPGWGEHVDPAFLIAFMEGRLLPVSQMNDGFFRPRYPQHIGHSYVQGSLVHDFLDERFGFEVIPRLLRAYADGADDAQAFASVLGWEMNQVDAAFDEYLRTRYAGQISALQPELARRAAREGDPEATQPDIATLRLAADGDPNDFVAHFSTGNALANADPVAAAPYLERAKFLFPTFGGAGSPYLGLARGHLAQGDPAAAIGELTALIELSDKHLEARLALADLLETSGAAGAAAAALETAFWIDLDLPDELADAARLHEEVGHWPAVVRARRALLGLAPADRAAAYYELARAYAHAEDARSARRAVLQALELAPSYQAAQELLLELRSRAEDT